MRGHTARIHSIAFSPDGRSIASSAGGGVGTGGWHDADENTVRIWDVATGEELARAETDIAVQSIAFTPDGRHVVTGGGRSEDPISADLRLWRLPEPGTIRTFGSDEKLITQDGVTAEEGGWRIEAKQNRTVRLFDVPKPGVEDCMLTYRAKIKTEGLQGRAYLEMWCRVAGVGESFSKGFQNAVTGTTGWASYETPFRLEKGQRPDLIKLNLVIEGQGTVWIKDIQLLKSPLPVQAEAAETQTETGQAAVIDAAHAWLKLLDDGKYGDAWEATAQFNKDSIDKQKLVELYNRIRKPLGQVDSRKQTSFKQMTSLPGAPDGQYAVIGFQTRFEKKKQTLETVVMTREKDGQWRVSGWALK